MGIVGKKSRDSTSARHGIDVIKNLCHCSVDKKVDNKAE